MEKTIKDVARTIYDNMESRKRDDGGTFYALRDRIQWQVDIIHAAHIEGRMPSDDIYDRIHDAVDVLSELDADADEDAAQERIQEIEPDVYTSDLTAWLNSHNGNVYYLDEAIAAGYTDGFAALAYAQSCYISEIANATLAGILDYIENGE